MESSSAPSSTSDRSVPLASHDLAQRFFGQDPVSWLSDLYNACDAIVMDGMDDLESAVLDNLRAMAAAGVDVKGRRPAAAAKGSGGARALEPAIIAQVQAVRGWWVGEGCPARACRKGCVHAQSPGCCTAECSEH